MEKPEDSGSRALIADDQPEVLEALRLLLKSEGIKAFAVSSPAAVLDALRTQEFDIVLVDLNYARDTTSGKEGLDLLDSMRRLDGTVPVIVMTGWGTVDLAVETMRRGVRDFVQKPWDNERLLHTVRTHIAQGQVLRRGRRLETELKRVTEGISVAADLHMLMDHVAERLKEALCLSSVTVFTKAALDQAFWATSQTSGLDVVGKLRFDSHSVLLRHMDEIFDPSGKELPESERARLAQAGRPIILPLNLKGELIGFIGLAHGGDHAAFDEDELKFLAEVVRQIGTGIENIRARGQQREFEEARVIQQGLLPKQIAQIPGHEIFGGWQPASAVGGDYYDALKFSECRVALCIADVSGKGMPAALLMSNLQAAVKAFASDSIQPRDLCSKVNRVICSNIAPNKFITFFFCIYDAERRRLVYSNAGHNAPILVRKDGGCIRLYEGGAVLGVFHDWNYEQNEVEFVSGDRCVLFTDGVTEVRNSEGEEFGEARLIDLLKRKRSLGAEMLQREVMHTVAEFSGGEFQDDATLIAISVDH